MPRRSLLALALTMLAAGCNKPAPTPSAAAPDTGTVDTVAVAGAPLTDSAMAATDSVAPDADTVTVAPDGANDSTITSDTTTGN